MTDLATAATGATRQQQHQQPLRATSTLAIGLLGGCALGIAARAWMRLIAVDPEFTWRGTLFIVGGFTVFGLTQSIVAIARRRSIRRWRLTSIRALGVIGMLPLFVAAGALMFPTVVGCGLALARTDWHVLVRFVCVVVAAGPVLFVAGDLVNSFGLSLHAIVGFVVMLAIYATIIWATRFTFSAPQDGRRLSGQATRRLHPHRL